MLKGLVPAIPTIDKVVSGVEVPMPTLLLVEATLMISFPPAAKIMSSVEVTVKAAADCNVRAPADVCQVEAAAPMMFKVEVAVMEAVPMVMVPPIVVVAT